MLDQPRQNTAHNNNIRNTALGLMGLFIGMLIFIVGVTVGAVLTRPGGLLFTGASPFPPSGTSTNLPAIGSSRSGEKAQLNNVLIDDVLTRVRREWYGDFPNNDKLTDGAIRGMLNSLGDQFTQYVEPKLAQVMEDDMSGAFEGVGATIKQNGRGDIQIVRTYPSMPADKAGVLAGDTIESVNGQRVTGMGTNEVVALLRGPRGTQVKLSLRRADNPKTFEVSITRDRIEIQLVTSKMVGSGQVGYVSLNEFSRPASEKLEKDIKALLDKKPKAIILDLRDNPGGLLQQAVEVGDIFLKEGPYVIERNFDGKKSVLSTSNDGIAQDIPMVVLVNSGSASASEIVAGALQDYGRAKLFGETTFGKGSVQSTQRLSNGGQLRITIQHWFTPKDRGIHGTGIAPDYVVVNTPADVKANRDPQLDAAVNYLLNGKTPAATAVP